MADTKKLEKLSDADIALFPSIVEEWVAVGLATGPANRAVAEKAIREAYVVAGFAEPGEILWFDDPFAAVQEINKRTGEKGTVPTAIYGQHEADWLSFYSFFDRCESVDIPEIKKLYPLMEVARQTGWWWPYDTTCFVSERPIELHRDAAGRLHAEEGMAIKYSSGWGVYAWHGYRIEKKDTWIITNKERITPDLIDKEPNAELRRIMLEIYGFDKYIEVRDAKVISEDVDGAGHPRRLLEMDVAGQRMRIIELNNSSLEPDGSRRKFHLGAMPGNTPHEAVAASFGFSPKVFNEEACS